ncbi:MAG: hypothetical protein EP350_07950 [Alphaproteobacteria bacterium]|nr:MAG: hypothetical protein EP350_07950 [Alphaproteobacteria bacterium]
MRGTFLSAIALVALGIPSTSIANHSEVPPIDASMIEAHSASFEFFVQEADGSQVPAGTWSDQVQIEGASLIRTVVRYAPDGNADLRRTIVADRNDLKPRTLDQRFGPSLAGVFHVDFAGNEVNQFLISSPLEPMRMIDAEFNQDVWELSLWGTLAMSLPFEVGKEFKVPTIGPDRKSVRQVTFQIEGTASFDFKGTSLEATQIFIPEENWRFWVRKSAPYILRIEHPAPDGRMAISKAVGLVG